MNIKSTISMIMFYLFSFLSIISFLLVGFVDDIPAGSIHVYLVLFLVFLFFFCIAVFFYDYRIYFRHLLATFCLVTLLYGCYREKRSEKYMYLYKIYLSQGNISSFYNYLLSKYDSYHEDVITVKDRLLKEFR